MTVDRMAEPLQNGRGAPVVDLIAPPTDDNDDAPPQDALEALLHTVDTGELTEAEKDKIRLLAQWKRARAEHKRKYEALGPDIDRLRQELIELVAERQLVDAKGRPYLPDVSDNQGFELHPYFTEKIWPKYRENPDTDQPFTQEDVVEVLRALGMDHLVVEKPESNAYSAYVRNQVKAWRKRVGQDGVTNEHGEFVDAFGNVLTEAEAADPLADILALPPLLRTVAEPVPQIDIQFTRREEKSRAVAAVQAVEGDEDDD